MAASSGPATSPMAITRLVAVHFWPAEAMAPRTIISAARAMSASGATITAFLPPSSSCTLACRAPAAAWSRRPTVSDPVKLTASTAPDAIQCSCTLAPSANTMFSTPAGRPASTSAATRWFAVRGVAPAGLNSTVLP